jgi:hypothetical protein
MSGVPPESNLERGMNKRTIPAAAAGLLLAAGLLTACSSGTTPAGPATTQAAVSTPSATPTPTVTVEATVAPTSEATASTAAPAVAQPSTLTLTVADGKASGRLVVKGTDQGVAGAEINLVFRPTGGGDPQISSVKTDASGAFASTSSASGAGTWTASFMGNAGAMASAASVG